MLKKSVEDTASRSFLREHATYEGFKFNIAVVEVFGHRANELNLIGLETDKMLVSMLFAHITSRHTRISPSSSRRYCWYWLNLSLEP